VVWVLSAALAAGILGRSDILSVAFGLLLALAWRRRLHRLGATLLIGLCFLLYAYGDRGTTAYEARCAAIDSVSVSVDEPIYCNGWVADYPVWSPGGVRFEFETSVVGCRQRLLVKANAFGVAYGERVRALVRLDPPARTRRTDYLRGRGVTGSAHAVPGGLARLPGSGGNLLRRRILWPVHDYLRRTMSRGCGSNAGVPMALLLGERGYLDRRTRDAFSTLGISHLLALSGFHLGFVTVTLLALLGACRVRSRLAVVACLLFYVGFVGVILSLYRALTMVILLVVAARLCRPLRPVTALANAFFLMLLLFPFALYSLGFQLSFMATLAVLLCVERAKPSTGRSRVGRFLHGTWTTLWVSGFVQLWVAPILLATFGGVSVVAPLATVVFVVPIVLTLALSAAAASLAAVPWGVGSAVFSGLGWVTTIFEWALRNAVACSPSPVAFPAPYLVLYYVGMWVVVRGGNLWITAGGVLATVAACVLPWMSS
jgi:ComEC/Rec2-related protein